MIKSKSPKIAYIMSRFPKISETFILYEILALRNSGITVELFPLLREQQPVAHKEAIKLTKEAHFHPFVSNKILKANWYFIRLNPIAYFKVLFEVLWGTIASRAFFVGAIGIFPKSVLFAYEMLKLDITHVHAHFATHPTVAALIIHRLISIPFSFTAHGSDLHVDRTMLDKKIQAVKFAVTISTYNKELMIKECGEEARNKIHVIHCGVDLNVHKFLTAKNNNRVFQIVCVASFEEVKGHKYLIDACKRLADGGYQFDCHFIGIGPLQEEIEDLAAQTGIRNRFHFHGGQKRQEVAEFFANADVKVLASVRTKNGKREGIPVVLMEAMASGLPVVASNLSGIPELVEDGIAGILVPPGDSQAFAEALQKLIENPDLRAKLGSNGRKKVMNEFNLQKSVAELRSLFLENNSIKIEGNHKEESIERQESLQFAETQD